MNLAQLDDVVVEVGSFAKPSSRKVNHRFTKRTTFSPKRGENNALRNDPGFLSSRHENPKVSATIGRQQAKFRVKKRTVMPLAKIADALAVVETPLQVEETIVPSAAADRKVLSLDPHPVASSADSDTLITASAPSATLCQTLQADLSKFANHSKGWRLHYKCLIPAPNIRTSSQGGKVPFVSLWRLLYGMLFAMLLQLNICSAAAAAAVGAGATHPPPLSRRTLWKDPPGASVNTKGAQAATLMNPAEQPSLRGHKEVSSVHSSHYAALSSFQNDSTNSTNIINYTWELTAAPLRSYEVIACSEDGQHVVAGNYHGYLFTSNDYGTTWNQTLFDRGYFIDITSSSDGQYWAAVSHFVGIFVSSDYGQSWSLSSAAPIGWYSIASSANGQFLSAASYYDSIYTSGDYGQTWNVTSAVSANWQSIDSSESGQYVAAVASGFGIYTSSDFGATWISSPSVGNEHTHWYAIVVSRSGQNLAVLGDGAVHISSDFGASWNVTSPSHLYWHYLISSGNGHFIAGGNYGFLASDDFGTTWMATRSVPPFSLLNAALSGDGQSGYGFESSTIYRMTRLNDSQPSIPSAAPTLPAGPHTWLATSAPFAYYSSIKCSDTGQYVVAGASYDYIYTSQDYGVTWNNSLPIVGRYAGLTSSGDGQYWAAISQYVGVYTSSDYGQSWRLVFAEPLEWVSITSSNNGQFLHAAPWYGSMYNSNDYGQTWHIVHAAGEAHWASITSSDDGQYLAATTQSSGIYLSTDYGTTWSITFPAGLQTWYSITASNSGQYLAANSGGELYTSSDYGASWSSLSYKTWSFISSGGAEHYIAGSYEGVYTSDDYGATWALSSVPFFDLARAALSVDGQYAFGIASTTIYRMTRQNNVTLAEPSALPTVQPTVTTTVITTATSTSGQTASPTSNTCPAGTFNAQPGQPTSLCAICPGGTYSTEGMNSCLSCPAGSFSTAWSSTCTQCPAGFYCLHGASAAVMCPSGTVSSAGASFCTACSVGQYSSPGSSTCLTCSSA